MSTKAKIIRHKRRNRPARKLELINEKKREPNEMLEGKATIQDTDMPLKMQTQATSCASYALDLFDVTDCQSIAAHIKREFDKRYGPGWQCVVGSNFGCFFSHKEGTFIYFSLEKLCFLVYKAAPFA